MRQFRSIYCIITFMSNSYLTVLDKLSSVIEKNPKYKVEDAINKNLLAEDTRKYDAELLNLLQKDKDLKSHFFAETDGGLVFKKDVFLQFISNKEFLPDSYTKYANKIGLGVDDGSLLSGSKDVVLNWPYKDAILEGGQDKEDQKRGEIFFNEILAPDQVSRLLDKKVFTDWARYDKEGRHDLYELKESDSLIIKGNNLVVLHSLEKRYANKVKLIYIDPPYNTGSDSFGYNDRFNHSAWLTFMKNRLEIAKRLMSNDGCIVISIDDNESPYLKVMLDEIFGRENFLANIAYERSGVSGLGQGGKFLVNNHESILCYAKSQQDFQPVNLYDIQPFELKDMKRYNKVLVNDGTKKEVARFKAPSTGEDVVIYKHSDYTIETIALSGYEKNFETINKQYADNFDLVYRTTSVQAENAFQNKILTYTQEGLFSAEYLVSRGKKAGENIQAYYINGQVFAWLRDIASIQDGKVVRTGKLSQFWSHASIPKADLANEGAVNLRRGKKPERLLKRILDIFTNSGDMVLDFHVGSGTTAAVAHKMGRQYIGIEQLFYGSNDPTTRLQNVIKGDQSGISKLVNWKSGGSFVYTRIMNNSESFRKRIEAAKDEKEYLALLKEATSSSFLSYRVDPMKLNENEFRKLSSSDKRRLLLELIDNNTLYVNYEDINDPSFKVSNEDKKFNKELYK
jgi:adenine-specific DNA-methyltransferase